MAGCTDADSAGFIPTFLSTTHLLQRAAEHGHCVWILRQHLLASAPQDMKELRRSKVRLCAGLPAKIMVIHQELR